MQHCPLKDDNYNGNCEGCTQKEFCMLSEVIERLRTLETTLSQMHAKSTG